MTGQCPCRSEFGGRQCDECGENHFGNPDLQCICESTRHLRPPSATFGLRPSTDPPVSSTACDCNLDGTQRPSCDPETGECMCRVGVTGIFCEECAPGYDPEFPACRECHPCNAMWAKDVTDVQRASQVLKKLVPNIHNVTRPADNRLPQRVLDLQSKLDGLRNLTAWSPLVLEEVEELYEAIRLVHV